MKYLFIYFIGEQEDGEQVYFSVSSDGLHWEDLNQGKPVLVRKVSGIRLWSGTRRMTDSI